ncbi:MAG TPA: hypothetical protein VFF24_11245 [Acidimicrobiia bacterium]|nr:hypothetical protein [Acidimicrobiia bacterium]
MLGGGVAAPVAASGRAAGRSPLMLGADPGVSGCAGEPGGVDEFAGVAAVGDSSPGGSTVGTLG